MMDLSEYYAGDRSPIPSSSKPQQPGAADWSEIAAKLNVEAGFHPDGSMKSKPAAAATADDQPAQAGAVSWDQIAAGMNKAAGFSKEARRG